MSEAGADGGAWACESCCDAVDGGVYLPVVCFADEQRYRLAAGQNTPVREKPSWRRGKPQLAKQRAAQEELVELADHDRARREWGDEM
jgi:hypothetical protein